VLGCRVRDDDDDDDDDNNNNNTPSNTIYTDSVVTRLYVSTMKQSSSGLSHNYLID
jgi:hypothetical protein